MPSLADRQLAAWQEIAADWDMTPDGKCGQCGKGIALMADSHGVPYCWTYGQLLALTVLHLRGHHAYLDPDKAL